MKLLNYHYVWLAISVGWLSNYMTRSALSPVLPLIQSDLALSYTEVGFLASIYFYAYMIIQIPAGTLGDMYGRKRLLVSATTMWGIFSAAIGFANNFFSIVLMRFLKGLTHGMYFSNDRAIISSVTPREKMGSGHSLSFIGIVGGSFIGVFLGGLVAEAFGWRTVFLIFSTISILGVFLLSKFLPSDETYQNQKTESPSRVKFGAALKDRDLWLLYLAGIPLVHTFWLVNTWGPTILKEILSESVAEASMYASTYSLAGVLGMYTLGKLSDYVIARRGNTKLVLLLNCGCITPVAFLSAYAIAAEKSLTVALFATSGFFLWSVWTPMYVLVSDLTPEEVRGTVFGVLNTIHQIGGITASWITGWLKDITGSFSASFTLAGILLLTTLMLVALVNPNNKSCGLKLPA